MAPSSSKMSSASSEGGKSKFHEGINAALKRGKALRKLQGTVYLAWGMLGICYSNVGRFTK